MDSDSRSLSQLGHENVNQLRDISLWGLPSAIVDNYREKGVEKMFQWQVECLLTDDVLKGKNLVYSAPTSAGKTLVSELLMLKKVLETRKKAIMILPFVSVTREKMFHFQNMFTSGGVRVGGYMGSHFPVGGFQSVDIAVCTIEKANALINKLLEEDALDQICCVVVDELHMLGESQRGYLLELLLTKLIFYQRNHPNCDIQLIGMSATLPNLDLVAKWLSASLFKTEYRPVPLTECLKVGSEQPRDVSTWAEASIPLLKFPLPIEDTDGALSLIIHTVSMGLGVLVFLPTKAWCEAMSQQIARAFLAVGRPPPDPGSVLPDLLELGAKLRAANNRQAIQNLLEQLKQTPAGLDKVLEKTVPFGVAFHHAGLTYDERDVVENAFKAGIINVLTATSTLSSGVNLPARRVIIRTPIFGRQLLDVLTYKQMIGRAGRKGIDDQGESILMCKDTERAQATKLATMKLHPVRSCLSSHGSVSSALKRAIMEVIASGKVKTLDDVDVYVKCTFLNECTPAEDDGTTTSAKDCLDYLVKNDFINIHVDEGKSFVSPTKLGSAVLASSLSPDQALLVLRELRKSRQSFVLENDLHIIYEVTPYFISEQAAIDWMRLIETYDALSEDRKRVAEVIGFEPAFVYKCIRAAATKREMDLKVTLHQRFYVALALNELVQEVPLSEVASKFALQKGLLQNLQQSAATFAGMVAIFCKRLGWHNLELLISQFQKRLHFGVQQELCDLLQLVSMTAQVARILFNSGFTTLPDVARAEVQDIETALRSARVYQAKQGENSADIRWIYLNGFDGLNEREAGRILIDEARKTLHDWLGVRVDFEKKEQPLTQQTQHATNCVQKQTETPQPDSEVDDSDSEREKPSAAEQCSSSDKRHEQLVSCEQRSSQSSDDALEQMENAQISDETHQVTATVSEALSAASSSNGSRAQVETSFRIKPQLFSTPNQSSHDLISSGVANEVNISMASSVASSGLFDDIVSPLNAADQPSRAKLAEDIVESAGDSIFDGVKTQDNSTENSIFDGILSNNANANPKQDSERNGLNVTNRATVSGFTLTPSKRKKLLKEAEAFTNSLRVAACKRSAEDEAGCCFSNAQKRVRRSLEEESKEFHRLAEDSMALFNSTQLNDITQKTKPKSDGGSQNINSEMYFDCVLTCQPQTVNSENRDNCDLATEAKDSFDMISTLCTPKSTEAAPQPNDDTDSDLFSDAENGTPAKSVKEYAHSEDQASFDLHLSSESAHSEQDEEENVYIAWDEIAMIRNLSEDELFQKIDSAKGRCSVALDTEPDLEQVRIGPLLKSRRASKANSSLTFEGQKVVGFVCATSPHEGYYFSMKDRNDSSLKLLEKLLQGCHIILLLDCIMKLKTIMVAMDILPDRDRVKFEDASIAHWLIDSSAFNPSLEHLCKQYIPEAAKILKKKTKIPLVCFEACAHLQLMKILKAVHVAKDISRHIFSKEMTVCWILARMDLNGFGYDDKACEGQINALRHLQFELETKMLAKAGRSFNVSSSAEVTKVIYSMFKEKLIQLKIITGREQPKSLRLSSKGILLKLAEYDELAQWIVDARKIASILARDMYPILRTKTFHQELGQHRIYTNSTPFTATGRVALNEPNLQSMARNFRSANHDILIRKAFIPMPGAVVLSADFAQLEMRLLAHLSNDPILCEMFCKPHCDIFVQVAAQWQRIEPTQVLDKHRQQAKELCYGIIYGKGVKSLAEDLAVTLEEGEAFMKSFHDTFPGIKKFTSEVVANCRRNGYVSTLSGRRRYLPQINSSKQAEKAKAERQAINSTIQGSAAELLKTSLIEIDSELSRRFPETARPHRAVKNGRKVPITGAFIVMQLHDEVILEVNESVLLSVSHLVRFKMEHAAALQVPLVVKLKTGPHWSSVTSFDAL